jgi:AraC-like DNA-binding protein/mannose-6-phosphate isomerase-like protein (cupin superfamily)
MQIYDIQTDDSARELTRHGSVEFPCASYDELFSKFVKGEVPWHWHDEFEFVYVVQGSTVIESVNKKIALKKGEAAFINSACLHRLANAGCGECRILNVLFLPTFINADKLSKMYQRYILPAMQNATYSIFKFSNESNWQKQLINELLSACSILHIKPEVYELQTQLHLMNVWTLMCSHEKNLLNSIALAPSRERRIRQCLSYIHQYYWQKISVVDIANNANVSESECYRLFKKTLGSSPNNYVLDYRLQQAVHLLHESDLAITQIALKCGFNCPAYFTKRFKRSYGKTPRQYRESKTALKKTSIV